MEQTKINIAIIPARKGSKRIPFKNIKPFCGKPIIAYPIETAKKSKLFDRIIVSTDSETIADVATSYGAEIPFMRPAQLADDFTGTNSVVRHAVQWFFESEIPIEYVCCIYATAPFLKIEYLREGYEFLQRSDKKFAFSVTTFSFPIFRAFEINKFNEIKMFWPDSYKKRSQDLPEAYHDAGQFYWGKPDAFLNDLPIFGNHSIPVILPRYYVQDIDTPEDWINAELLYKALATQQGLR